MALCAICDSKYLQGIIQNQRAAPGRTKKGTYNCNFLLIALVTDTKVPLFKDHFWHFQIKIKFRKKIRGTAASNYRMLISSELFPVYINSNLDVTVPAGAKQGQFTLQSIEKLEIPQIPKMIFSKQISGSLDDFKLFLPRYHLH